MPPVRAMPAIATESERFIAVSFVCGFCMP